MVLGAVVLGEHLDVSRLDAVLIASATAAMAAATIALGRDEGAYEEQIETQSSAPPVGFFGSIGIGCGKSLCSTLTGRSSAHAKNRERRQRSEPGRPTSWPRCRRRGPQGCRWPSFSGSRSSPGARPGDGQRDTVDAEQRTDDIADVEQTESACLSLRLLAQWKTILRMMVMTECHRSERNGLVEPGLSRTVGVVEDVLWCFGIHQADELRGRLGRGHHGHRDAHDDVDDERGRRRDKRHALARKGENTRSRRE